MNKKDLAQIKRNFTEASSFMTLNHVLCAFVDADKNIVYSKHQLHGIMPAEEAEIIMDTLKKSISGSMGKSMLEFEFGKEAYEEDGAQGILYRTMRSKLLDDEQNQRFLEQITKNIQYESTFAVFAGHFTYDVMTKDKNNEELDVSESQFNFIVTAICPVEIADDALVYDDIENSLFKKHNTDRIVSRTPSDGFMYPAFSENAADVNKVLYYTKSAKKPNVSIIDDVLGCRFTMTANDEKETFRRVLNDVVGDELDYTVITKVNEKIKEVIDENKYDADLPSIDDIKLRDILYDVGVSDEKLQTVHKVYKDNVGEKPLTAQNLVSSKTVVATPEITINISKEATEKIRTSVIEGRRCLVIDLDDPQIMINGLPTTVTD